MNITLNYNKASGSLHIPSSKSHTQRVYAAALLHNGTTIVEQDGTSQDELAALCIIQQLGANVQQYGTQKHITSSGKIYPLASQINCGESGLAARMFTPIAALASQPILITGQGSLLHRPMELFGNTLKALKVKLSNFEGHLPFTIQGPLQAANIIADGTISSQYISGLLFALAASATKTVSLQVDDLVSKPYIDMTLEVLAHFGHSIDNHNYQQFIIKPQLYTHTSSIHTNIQADWSSAAFWIAAAAINGQVSLKGLQQHSTQADKKLLYIIQQMGANASWHYDTLNIAAQQLQAVQADLSHSPDLFPVLAILAASAQGTSMLHGLPRLTHKESNRAEAISNLLSLLGVQHSATTHTLTIHGQPSFESISYHCPHDHRMAMAAALAAMRSQGPITIANAQCVDKSYPSFWAHTASNLSLA